MVMVLVLVLMLLLHFGQSFLTTSGAEAGKHVFASLHLSGRSFDLEVLVCGVPACACCDAWTVQRPQCGGAPPLPTSRAQSSRGLQLSPAPAACAVRSVWAGACFMGAHAWLKARPSDL